MIIASILNNYKCYRGTNFVKFISESTNEMNVIIGNNGVGKSAILEGMNSFFNDAEWIINSSVKDDVFVGMVFLIDKEKVKQRFTAREVSFLDIINSVYWDKSTGDNLFSEMRNHLLTKKEDSYLVAIKKEQMGKNYELYLFKNMQCDEIESIPITSLNNMLQKIVNIYSYLYIPVESSVPEFLKLETQGLQTLMNKSIREAINKALNDKRINRRKKKISELQIINEELEAYIQDVETDIKKINAGYNYSLGYKQTKQLTANHVTEVIIDSFYKKRRLKKNNTPIETLSSGEKRIALIDIIYVFSSKNENPEKELILAIDEPENSLNVSYCYDQFEKLSQIARTFHHQLFITTHWYGAIPVIYNGNLLHIDGNHIIKNFDLYNYYEERRNHPDDIQLKGYFDFVSSLLNAFRNENYSWLLVEGKEDKKYLEFYLRKQIDNVRIVPLGGCANVKKIYEYLYISFNGAGSDFINAKNNKIICLVDTDTLCTPLAMGQSHLSSNHPLSKNLKIYRLNENEDNHNIDLKTIEDPNKNPTEIENVLNPQQFYDALNKVIEQIGNEDEKTALSKFEFNPNVKNSRISGDYSILNPISGNCFENKTIICDFIDKYKYEIANTYTSLGNEDDIPDWIKNLVTLLKS